MKNNPVEPVFHLSEITGDVEYLDFMTEHELREIVTEMETDVMYPVEFPVRYGVVQGPDGKWYDALQRPSYSSVVIPCPFVNDLMAWRIPLGDGPIFYVESVRTRRMETGAWFWRVCLRRM